MVLPRFVFVHQVRDDGAEERRGERYRCRSGVRRGASVSGQSPEAHWVGVKATTSLKPLAFVSPEAGTRLEELVPHDVHAHCCTTAPTWDFSCGPHYCCGAPK